MKTLAHWKVVLRVSPATYPIAALSGSIALDLMVFSGVFLFSG